VLAVFLAAAPASIRADSLEDTAQLLARKVCGAPRQQTVRINWQESPELSGSFSGSIKKAFLTQLSACGIATGKSPDFPLLLISIRPTASKLLLVAHLEDSAGGVQIRMAEMGREALSNSNESSRAPRLQRELLWQQERPVESAMEWFDRSSQDHSLFLVSQGSLVRLRLTNEVWAEVDSAVLPRTDRPFRLGGEIDKFVIDNAAAKLQVLVNRKLCAFDPEGRLSLTCSESDIGGQQLSIVSGCDSSTWSLWSDTGDYAQRDRIFCGSPAATEAGLPAFKDPSYSLEMSGPVLDLSTTLDSKSAVAVVRNLTTGNYEVYRITLACAN
jgi:hypothetical protein